MLWSLLLALVAVVAADDTNSTGLDGGVVAGIVVGSIAGVAILGGLIYYFFVRSGSTGAAKLGIGANAANAARQPQQLAMLPLALGPQNDEA